MKVPVTITVNGRTFEREVEPRLLLVHFLRDVAGLDRHQGRLRHQPVRRLHGARWTASPLKSCTVSRGSGRRRVASRRSRASRADGALHRLQEAFWAKHGLQCGFCTPGHAARAVRTAARQPHADARSRSATGSKATCAAAPAIRTSSAPCSRRPPAKRRGRPIMTPLRLRHASSARAFDGAKIRGSSRARRATPTTSCCPGCVHAAILRSPHGHAHITRIDTSRAARRAPGVVAVYHRRRHRGGAEAAPMRLAGAELRSEDRAAIRHGQGRRAVRGRRVSPWSSPETPYQAHDALDLIDVDYEPLPAVVDPQKAAASGAPQLHADIARQRGVSLDGRGRRRRRGVRRTPRSSSTIASSSSA